MVRPRWSESSARCSWTCCKRGWRANMVSKSASRCPNSSLRAGLPAPTSKSSMNSCRLIIPASPKTSTATGCSWRATNLSLITPANARLAWSSPTSRISRLVDLDIRGFDHRRPARDLATDAGAKFFRRAANHFHELRGEFFTHRRLLDDLDDILVDLIDQRLWRAARR